jgi:hypothetical protein
VELGKEKVKLEFGSTLLVLVVVEEALMVLRLEVVELGVRLPFVIFK